MRDDRTTDHHTGDQPVETSGERPGGRSHDARTGPVADDDRHSDDAGLAAHLREQRWVVYLLRTGWVAKGVVYGAFAWAALEIAEDTETPFFDADYTGLLSVLAGDPSSRFVLALIAAGLACFVAFRVVSVALIDGDDADAWVHRVAFGASALTYTIIAWAAVTAVLRGEHDGDDSTVESVTRSLLESSTGRVILGAGGVATLVVAGYFVVKGATRRFMRQIDVDAAPNALRRPIEWSGAAGWVGRGCILGPFGAFVTWAAVDVDAHEVRGLDRSLHRVSDVAVGETGMLAIAALLITYAVFCVMSAPYRRLIWDTSEKPVPPGEGFRDDP